jgi:hypothetical protein
MFVTSVTVTGLPISTEPSRSSPYTPVSNESLISTTRALLKSNALTTFAAIPTRANKPSTLICRFHTNSMSEPTAGERAASKSAFTAER